MYISYRTVSPRTLIFFSQLAAVFLLAFVIYQKYFEDKVVSEGMESAVVVEVQAPSGGGVGANYMRVQVKLKDGANANTLYSVGAPSVGQSIDVMVKTYESGARQVSSIEY